jgi:hypothetical protein
MVFEFLEFTSYGVVIPILEIFFGLSLSSSTMLYILMTNEFRRSLKKTMEVYLKLEKMYKEEMI